MLNGRDVAIINRLCSASPSTIPLIRSVPASSIRFTRLPRQNKKQREDWSLFVATKAPRRRRQRRSLFRGRELTEVMRDFRARPMPMTRLDPRRRHLSRRRRSGLYCALHIAGRAVIMTVSLVGHVLDRSIYRTQGRSLDSEHCFAPMGNKSADCRDKLEGDRLCRTRRRERRRSNLQIKIRDR